SGEPGDCCPQPDFTEIVDAINDGSIAIEDAINEVENTLDIWLENIRDQLNTSLTTIKTTLYAGFKRVASAITQNNTEIDTFVSTLLTQISEETAIMEQEPQQPSEECSEENPDGPCSSCGCKPCTCEDGECVPENPENCQYTAYASLSLNDIVVTE